MSKISSFAFIVSVILSVVACKNNAPAEKTATTIDTASNQRIDKICDEYYAERMKWFPFEATQNNVEGYNDLMPTDIADSYRDSLRTFFQKYRQLLQAADAQKLDATHRTSYDILAWDLDRSIEGLSFHDNYMPLNQFVGAHLSLAQLGAAAGAQPFVTVQDYDNWLKRMSHFGAWVDTAIGNMRRGIAQNIVLPKALTVKVLPELKDVIKADVTKSVFWAPIEKLPKDFSAADKTRLTEAYRQMITKDVNANYQRLHDFMEKEYLPQSRPDAAITATALGKNYYAYLAKQWTTTELTPDEIFAIGEKEVARIHAEMEKIKEQVGFKGDLKAFFKEVNSKKQLFPYKKEADVIADFDNIHERMKPQLAKLYDLTPKTGFQVRRTEPFREASASAEYNQGSPDGKRPGVFYFPIPKGDATKINNFQNEALFLHEAIPGHHYQISLQQENTTLPKFRRFLWYGAYGEGYALYCEGLGKELGLYNDPYQYFGRLGMEMHRALRLVIDVGLHTKGWTREKAIQYDLDNEAETEESVIAEVERYMAIPGQALSYKIGEQEILKLKNEVKTKLGDKFDVKKFHNELLNDGCVPLKVLAQKMSRL